MSSSIRSGTEMAGHHGGNGDVTWYQETELRVCSASGSLVFVSKATKVNRHIPTEIFRKAIGRNQILDIKHEHTPPNKHSLNRKHPHFPPSQIFSAQKPTSTSSSSHFLPHSPPRDIKSPHEHRKRQKKNQLTRSVSSCSLAFTTHP